MKRWFTSVAVVHKAVAYDAARNTLQEPIDLACGFYWAESEDAAVGQHAAWLAKQFPGRPVSALKAYEHPKALPDE